MNNFLRYIRRNTLQIVLIVLFIIFIYSIIHAADNVYKNQAKNVVQAEEGQEEKVTTNTTISSKECDKILKTFLEYCTKGEYEKAYNYLSEESKENFPTLEDFKNNYCLQNSIKGKGYSIERASDKIKNRYKITFNNLLSSGNKNQNTDIDYYIVVLENEEDLRIKIER